MQKEKNTKKKKNVKNSTQSASTTGSNTSAKCKVSTESSNDCKKLTDNKVQRDANQLPNSSDLKKDGEELMNQFKKTADKLRSEIKSRLDEKFTQLTGENSTQLSSTAADDAVKLKQLLEKAMIDEENVKSASKSSSSGTINVTLDESQEKNCPKIVQTVSSSSIVDSSSVDQVNVTGNISSENSAKVSEKVITHVPESPSQVPVTCCTDQVDVKVKSNQQSSSNDKVKLVTGKSKQNASTLASLFDRNKSRPLTPKLTIDEVITSVATCSSDEEKIKKLAHKLCESTDHQRILESQMRNQEKMIAQLIKEKENFQSEHSRTLLGRSRLESLCRELQRQNRSVKEEALSKIKEEEDKRREVASKFQATLNEVLSVVQENQGRNDQLKAENLDLLDKLKAILSHYELWEASVQKLIQQKDLEVKLLTAKMAHNNELVNQERDRSANEKEILFNKITDLQEKAVLMDNTEAHLKEEISAYKCKYDEFQKVLTKSNDTFSQFKKDMDKMSKQMKKLDRETLNWKSKFESCNRELLTVSQEKITREKELIIALGKIETLQKLCRALQARNNIDESVPTTGQCNGTNNDENDQCTTCSTSHT